jgi:uncharacterized integral membrane protein
MRLKLIIAAILFLIFAIIASQNTITTELEFLFWSVRAPLIVMITVIFILGLVTGIIFCGSYEKKKRKEEKDFQQKTEKDGKTGNTQDEKLVK